jgi:hypothetical protein
MEWTKTHDHLQLVMKRELDTMRQLLDNMNLEEQFIMRKEQQYWGSMMEERGQLIQELELIRRDKAALTETLGNASLEELLPIQDASSWEILSLRDQIVTLVHRMTLQKSRNEMLLQLAQTPMLQPESQSKKKITIATLPPEGYKEGDE